MTRCSGIAALLLLLLLSPAAAQPFHIDPTTQQIVDDCGRARIFHGVNAVSVGCHLVIFQRR